MVGAISSIGSVYSASAIYGVNRAPSNTLIARRGTDPETPVQPIRPVVPVTSDAATPVISAASSWDESYAAEQAVRLRIQSADPDIQNASERIPGNPISQSSAEFKLPAGLSYDPAELAVRMRIQYMGDAASTGTSETASDAPSGIDGAQKATEEGRCETCEKRKYQDSSDDPSVSFQTPGKIDPDTAASTVRGHELEHVFHEQSKAEREGRKVVSQSVTLHTDICPECGRVYISGGTTRTITKADNQPEATLPDNADADKK